MRIIKLLKNIHNHYSVIFDEIPKITYEKVGNNYIGSYEENGKVIFSNYLKKESYGNAFGGRELHLNMKDGNVETIKDYWFDYGSYEKHGEFVSIGAGTLEDLQKCYVYCSKNINKEAFEEMLEEYLTRDKIYDDYRQIEDWCKLQCIWYPVIIRGKRIPFMMNKQGDMVERESKKRVYPRSNRCKKVKDKFKTYTYFKFDYKENNRLIKIEANYFDVLRETLPFTDEDIIKNCNLKDSYINMNNKSSVNCFKVTEAEGNMKDLRMATLKIEKDEIIKKYTRQEFIDIVTLIGCSDYNIPTKNYCNGNAVVLSECRKCITEGIKDIQFKGEEDCIDDITSFDDTWTKETLDNKMNNTKLKEDKIETEENSKLKEENEKLKNIIKLMAESL